MELRGEPSCCRRGIGVQKMGLSEARQTPFLIMISLWGPGLHLVTTLRHYGKYQPNELCFCARHHAGQSRLYHLRSACTAESGLPIRTCRRSFALSREPAGPSAAGPVALEQSPARHKGRRPGHLLRSVSAAWSAEPLLPVVGSPGLDCLTTNAALLRLRRGEW